MSTTARTPLTNWAGSLAIGWPKARWYRPKSRAAGGGGESYIVVQLKMQPVGQTPFSATQVIGWDASQQKIRSFMFDSRAFTEGVWTNEGDGWVVKAVEAHPNGTRTASTKIYSRIDENTAIWESIDDEVAGRARR